MEPKTQLPPLVGSGLIADAAAAAAGGEAAALMPNPEAAAVGGPTTVTTTGLAVEHAAGETAAEGEVAERQVASAGPDLVRT